ncbi:CHAT domain-containing protein [Streptosporangium vulgare]|uniref:CHAT domain-containing protein n=1 Tax=Streptosporangium vulgare TaxID=46190 RepID=A0ABV5TT66_9ACTN
MPIDDLTARARSLVDDYRRTRDRAPILDAEADRDAAALWRTVWAVDPGTASPWLRARLVAAQTALGWLHYWRYRESAPDQGHTDLARALLCFEPVSDDFSVVPAELNPMIGRFTEPDEQADTAQVLLRASSAGRDPALLDAGILLMTPASRAAPKGSPARGHRFSLLCLALRRRHERDGSAADLDQAISAGREAVAHDAEEAPSRLAFAYWRRYRLRADPADLDEVITLFTRVRERTGPRATVLSDLGTAYRQRYEHTRERADLEQAVTLIEQAARLPEGRASRAVQADLGTALLYRYERFGARSDLWRAAELVEAVLAAVPPHDPQRADHLAKAASVLLKRYERSRSPADVDRAVDLNEQALEALPDEDARRPAILGGLAVALHQRYRGSGAETDLTRAATLGGWALAATRVGHPDRARASMDLAAIHLTRHLRTGVLAEMARAIELGEQVLASTPACPPAWLAMLGSAYRQRYPVTGDVTDLAQAIDLGERSLAATDSDDFALAGRRVQLAAAYWLRHGRDGGGRDLDRAIDLGERAVAGTPDDHVDLPGWMSSLAAAHLARYRLGQAAADMEAAVDLGERALALLPAGHPSASSLTAGLCAAYLERVTTGGEAPDRGRLRELARIVTDAPAAAPGERVAAHHAVGALAHAAGQDRLAVTMLDTAVALLPSVAPREAGWADQQHRLGASFGLVGTGVAAHCAIGDPAGAVEIAELGRGVLLASQANTRVDLVELRSRDPRLADRFRWVCERLNTPDFPADERRRWWADYDGLLADIRALPDMGRFLAAPRLAGLRSATSGGCVILVSAGVGHGDAVIVRSDLDPVAIRLPELRLADVEAKVATLLRAVRGRGSITGMLLGRQAISGLLSWLWVAVVEPVLDALGPRGATPHRVWWLPIGSLGLLPLHAAGLPGKPGALDAMVSSFVPTLRTLKEARDRRPGERRHDLTIALRHTPGFDELPGIVAEAAMLGGPALIDDQATADRVLAALKQATWAHFACHAVADPASQAESGLLLHDRTLRLPEIGGLRLADAELAYLSACSTADHGVRYADEVLHLASAFQLAGFRHVVASLWPLHDEVAAEAARSFYRELPGSPVADSAAAVLNGVTLGLRDASPDCPDLWAPLVHSGP